MEIEKDVLEFIHKISPKTLRLRHCCKCADRQTRYEMTDNTLHHRPFPSLNTHPINIQSRDEQPVHGEVPQGLETKLTL